MPAGPGRRTPGEEDRPSFTARERLGIQQAADQLIDLAGGLARTGQAASC